MNPIDAVSDYITQDYWDWKGFERHKFDVLPGGTLTANITGLNEDGQQLARWALEAWTNVSGILFEFVTSSDADIAFTDDETGATTQVTVLEGITVSAVVNIPESLLSLHGSEVGDWSFYAYLHETGHALGLGHPGPYDSNAAFWFDNRFLSDSMQISVMSYFSQTDNTYINASFAYPVTPMIADIAAIHSLYGAPENSNEGATKYGYKSNVEGYMKTFFDQWTVKPVSPTPTTTPATEEEEPDTTPTTTPSGSNPFAEQSNNPFSHVDVTFNSVPAFADLDNDGDLDLVLGNGWSFNDALIVYYQNNGTTFVERTGSNNPFSGLALGNKSAPALADLDGDGDLDMIAGNENGTLDYFQNVGSATNPRFSNSQVSGLSDVGDDSKPALIDMDGDSDLDLVVGNGQGNILYFENTGTADSPAYSRKSGDDNPFNHINLDEDAAPTLADIDQDGDPDLVVGYNAGLDDNVLHYENVGTASGPDFTDSPSYSLDIFGFNSNPVLADIDDDGDVDLVLGDDFGDLVYFNNASATSSLAGRTLNSDSPVALTIYDTGGYDTLDLRTDTNDQRVDLRPGGISDVYGMTGNLVIAENTSIEQFVAGSGDDFIRGNESANRLLGRTGNDTLMGGDGADKFAFYESDGHDTILDFTVGEDKIDLRFYNGIDDFDDLAGEEKDGNLIIYLSDDQDTSVTLPGFALADITSDDFLFS